ncbi:BON domain-containing protein [Methylomarinum sp. Ch1-1]|uniref:BON domain-containing protein n=1 Tax=Methylomarinum roseum TaxID=3067653 RepID=A0AAU7NXP1_9GAMM|nr:BON domain-containing protein [Methylomarinum sp. Ch1-1]MDP4522181.1 BON domain-containing protein [Methylomarinum sp. Ch1-1]
MKTLIPILLIPILTTGCTTLATGSAEVTGLSLLHDRRTSEALLNDERIEINAGIELNANDAIRDRCHFNVTAYNGKVLLTGEAPTVELRDNIVAIVRVIPGVKMVHNEMAIAEPTTLASRSNDTLITAKTKSSLSEVRNLPGFDATRVKVVTENGVVFLMGLLHPNEGNVATEIARRQNGVKQVVKVFEYIESGSKANAD